MAKKKTTRKTFKNTVNITGTSCGCKSSKCGSGGCVYGLGFIGAAVFYLSQATGFWNGVLGFLKALVWPAFLVHGLLKFLAG